MTAVGDRVWCRGGFHGGWQEREIVGQTRVSWVIGSPGTTAGHWDVVKVKKAAWPHPAFLLNEQVVANVKWLSAHVYHISQALRVYHGDDQCSVFRQVAKMIGYDEEKKR